MNVLDASALLAFLNNEPGAQRVQEVLATGDSVIHTVNWAEVLTKRAERGDDPVHLHARLTRAGLIGQLLTVDPGQPDDALQVAAFRALTRPLGLSLGDRYCLALGLRLQAPVLTADRAWTTLSLGITVELIRP
ncbi:type II toxin-antitoxin system VapC family toxin [Deinococcus ruber]|uniref:PIN domain-containing protein n=1 Tax=Deinococcus ruber TaxID=1848197 RepID=A0A918CGB3_9DEIO|nr:type II toxin-antitoxin system VapC family toxin [Deinococcus ruber]GGR20060.1 hypothetical protein GCM10008957_35590 [Deinococcus ruber]